jgi:MFS transporter, MHS family, proline/betaine transporter
MRKIVVSGMIGNGLEWYDYALYGQVAWLLSELFFPPGDSTAQLMATFSIFAAGFLVRPLGAAFFGWLGDKYGRRSAMVTAILMMAIPTGLIGLLPTYADIGLWAPFLLLIIRLLQGISLGGEFSGSITYIVEHAPQHRRGLAGAASLVSLMLGFMLGIIVVRGLIAYVGEEAFSDWGWRIPFIIGIAIGAVGFYIRHHCEESPVYEEAKKDNTLSETPVRTAFKEHPREMLQGFGAYISVTMPFYLTTVFFITFMKKHLGTGADEALEISMFNMIAMLITIPISAWASDTLGRRRIMMIFGSLMFVSVYPLFSVFEPGQDPLILGSAQFVFCLLLGAYMGPVAAMLVELFPTSVRFSGMAIAYNLSAAIFGGSAPLVCEWLLKATGNDQSIAYYVMACNFLSLVALYSYKDRFKEKLR